MKCHKYDFGVSYSTKDIKLVEYFVNTLENKYGINIFFDRTEDSEFVGRDIDKKLESKYSDCQFVIFFWTENYLKTDWTKKEFEYIKNRSKFSNIFAIGILVDDIRDDPFLIENHHLELNLINKETLIESIVLFLKKMNRKTNLNELLSLLTKTINTSTEIKSLCSIRYKSLPKEKVFDFISKDDKLLMSIKLFRTRNSITVFSKKTRTFNIRGVFHKDGDLNKFINYSFSNELENTYLVDDIDIYLKHFKKTIISELYFQERMVNYG